MPLHLFVVHFPVALIVLGAAGDVAGALLQSVPTRRWAGTLLVAGAAFAILAFVTGQSALTAMGPAAADAPRVAPHTQWGAVGVWALVGGGALRAAWRRDLAGGRGWTLLAVAVLSAAIVVGIALSGTAILHG